MITCRAIGSGWTANRWPVILSRIESAVISKTYPCGYASFWAIAAAISMVVLLPPMS